VRIPAGKDGLLLRGAQAGVAVLGGVDEAVVENNVVDSTTSTRLAWLTGTHNITVRGNTVRGSGAKQGVLHTGDLGPNRDTVIEASDFTGPDLDAIVVPPSTVSGPLVARYNRFAPQTRGVVASGSVQVDARYNWWGATRDPARPGARGSTGWAARA
jgi:hypothetical protein